MQTVAEPLVSLWMVEQPASVLHQPTHLPHPSRGSASEAQLHVPYRAAIWCNGGTGDLEEGEKKSFKIANEVERSDVLLPTAVTGKRTGS